MSLDSGRPGTQCRTVFIGLVCMAVGALLTIGCQQHVGFMRARAPLSEPAPLPQPWWRDLHEHYVDVIKEAEEGKVCAWHVLSTLWRGQGWCELRRASAGWYWGLGLR